MTESETKPAKKKSSWINLLVDYGPVLVFFVAYRMSRPADSDDMLGEISAITRSTAAFVVATLAALAISKFKLGKISPMLWLTTVLVVGFGALTILTQDPFWIRHKPTGVYLLFGVLLLAGWLRGKALLKVLLAAKCEQHHVAAKLVANSDDIDRLATEDMPDVPAMHGWRREVFGADAQALKAGRIALGVDGKKIKLLPA